MDPAGSAAPRNVTAWERDGVLYLSAGDLALLGDVVKHWRSELGRMTFTFGRHEVAVMEGSDLAVIDGTQLLHLPGPVFLWEGSLMIPLQLVVNDDGRARDWIELSLSYSRKNRTIGVAKGPQATVAAVLEHDESGWNLILNTKSEVRYEVVQTDRSGFVLRLLHSRYDPLLYPLPPAHRWYQGLRLRNLPDGVEVSFSPSPRVVGYRVAPHRPHGVEIYLGLDERDLRTGRLRAFSEQTDQRLERPRKVVLLAGHGDGDPGASLKDGPEADLTLEVARLAAERIQDQLDLEVVLARPGRPGGLSDGDLLISIHFHDRSGGPAAFVPQEEGGLSAPNPTLASLGFYPIAGAYEQDTTPGRLLARSVLDAVSGRLGAGSLGIFDESLVEWSGASMPVMALELGRGGPGWSRERRAKVAAGIAEGIRLYQLAVEDQR